MAEEKVIETGVLVIGGGMAGSFAAIKARELGCDVTLVDKGYIGKSGATHFAGGDFMVFTPEWGHNLNAWKDQFNTRCEYLNNRKWCEIVLEESYERYQDLLSWGIKLYQEGNNVLVGRAGVTEYVSMVYREYTPILRKKALETGVRLLDRIMISELLKQEGKVVGAVGFHTIDGNLYVFKAKVTVIAAGGASLKEGNRPIHYATSDGEAMAYRAGAEITGKEFKFGSAGRSRAVLMAKKEGSEVGEFQVKDGWARFPAFRGGLVGPMVKPTFNAEGGPVFSAVWEAHCGREPLYVDLDAYTPEQRSEYQRQFNRMGTRELDKLGIDIFEGGKLKFSAGSIETAQPIGGGASGIWPIDDNCATSLPGLYAAGDSCATMLSGAGYAGLGSALCHAAVTGTRAGLGAAHYALKTKQVKINQEELNKIKNIVLTPIQRKGGFSPSWVTQLLQNIIVPYFILHIKQGERLRAALTLVEFLNSHLVPKLKAEDPHGWRTAEETKNMALHAELMLRASIFRTESRGSHFREDYPRRDDPKWLVWLKIHQEENEVKILKEPVPKEWWPDLSKPYEERYPIMFPGE